jgi:hypothetical protein
MAKCRFLEAAQRSPSLVRMRRRGNVALLASIGVIAVAASAVLSAQQGISADAYAEPRYPAFLINPSKEQLIDAARVAVRQSAGRSALAKAPKGTPVHVFLPYAQDMEVWDALKRAWAEQGVNAVAIQPWEAYRIPREEYEKRAKANLMTGGTGWKELGAFEPAYIPFFPADVQKALGTPMTVLFSYLEYKKYLAEHPEVKHVFAGSGGGKGFFGMFTGKENEEKFLGNWALTSKTELLSNMGVFPPDLWKMIDEETVRPIPHVSEGTLVDPEGTNLHWVQTPQESQIWEQKSGLTNYSGGHLNVYPPSSHAIWKKGVIRAGANHTGFYPTMTVRISERGRVKSIEGGGRAGELFRMLFNHPKFKNANFPTAPEPGYWTLAQDGLGSNPKAVRNYYDLSEGRADMANLVERNRAGVQHMSFSSPGGFGYDADPQDVAYAAKIGVPLRHTAHMHIYFPTVKWRLRDTGEVMTVVNKGRMAALDNPEVRALAARYGDPDTLLSHDWVPAIPGVNVKGSYEQDYAKDPWAYLTGLWSRIRGGTYEGTYVPAYKMIRTPEGRATQ